MAAYRKVDGAGVSRHSVPTACLSQASCDAAGGVVTVPFTAPSTQRRLAPLPPLGLQHRGQVRLLQAGHQEPDQHLRVEVGRAGGSQDQGGGMPEGGPSAAR
jgi:hypothetical protein